jgi:hypothetical protein
MRNLLIIIAALFIVWRFLVARGRRMADRGGGADDFSRFSYRSRQRRQRQERQRAEKLLQCSVCGTYIPAERALPAGDNRVFCSETCQQHQSA